MRGNPVPPLFSQRQPYTSDPDVILMLEFQKGDKASFEKLMEKYYKRILNFAYRFTRNEGTAEDLTQEVFIKVYYAGASYRPQAKFQTWLYTIAKNTCLNEMRRNQHKDVSLNETFESEESELKRQVADEKIENPSTGLLRKEVATEVKDAIHSLPENQRTAVILKRYENLSYKNIAKTMNCSVKAVKSLLNRAKENLKEKLSPFIDT